MMSEGLVVASRGVNLRMEGNVARVGHHDRHGLELFEK